MGPTRRKAMGGRSVGGVAMGSGAGLGCGGRLGRCERCLRRPRRHVLSEERPVRRPSRRFLKERRLRSATEQAFFERATSAVRDRAGVFRTAQGFGRDRAGVFCTVQGLGRDRAGVFRTVQGFGQDRAGVFFRKKGLCGDRRNGFGKPARVGRRQHPSVCGVHEAEAELAALEAQKQELARRSPVLWALEHMSAEAPAAYRYSAVTFRAPERGWLVFSHGFFGSALLCSRSRATASSTSPEVPARRRATAETCIRAPRGEEFLVFAIHRQWKWHVRFARGWR